MLLSCIGKMYSGLLNNQLRYFLEVNEVLSEEQNGFRKGRSTTEHIFSLITLCKNRLRECKQTFCCFVDFQKAFDCVDRICLFTRLLEIGITGKLFNAIKSCYEHTTCRIRLHDYVSESFENNIGVRQGDSLSPTLFILFINDLAEEIKRSGIGVDFHGVTISLLLYADDVVLLAEAESDLQNLISVLNSWCKRWRLNVNKSKTQIMHIRKQNQSRSEFVFKLNDGEVLQYASAYKYLGLLLDEHMNASTLTYDLSIRGSKALGSLLAHFYANNGMGFSTFKTLYEVCIAKVCDYSAGVWGYGTFPKLDSVHSRALRCYLGLHRYAPLAALEAEVGFNSSPVGRMLEMV